MMKAVTNVPHNGLFKAGYIYTLMEHQSSKGRKSACRYFDRLPGQERK